VLEALIDSRRGCIICLQEADADFVSGFVAVHTEFTVARQLTNPSAEGTCILATKDVSSAIAATAAVDLGKGKTAVAVLLQPPLVSEPLWLASLHLQGGGGEDTRAIRRSQLQATLAELGGASRVSAVLCGDWNDSDPSRLSSDLRILPAITGGLAAAATAAALDRTGPPPTGLSADFSARVCIDWVAVTSDVLEKRVSRPVVQHVPTDPWGPHAQVGSDHVPLFFRIDAAETVCPRTPGADTCDVR
jgi:endonuclease/exonuclease/phosphatase family metal-dependent hydrolase